jgi:hypothetical protein
LRARETSGAPIITIASGPPSAVMNLHALAAMIDAQRLSARSCPSSLAALLLSEKVGRSQRRSD